MINLPKVPNLPTHLELPTLPAGLPGIPKIAVPSPPEIDDYGRTFQSYVEKLKQLRETNKVFFDEVVCVGDLFVIHNNDKAFKHFVISIENGENIAAFTCDRLIKVFSFSRNCVIQFYRGPAYQDIWLGSFSESDISFSYNYTHLPLVINKVF